MNDTEHICRLEPNPKQTQFFESKAKYTAYGGARGGGKSWAMRTKLILLAIRYPGINILLLRRTLGELRENHILPMRQLLEGFAEYRESGREFLFRTVRESGWDIATRKTMFCSIRGSPMM